MTGLKIKSGGLSDWEPLGVSGDPVYRAASQILNLIKKELGVNVAAVFATPLRDDQRLTIDWYSSQTGEVKSWNELSHHEQDLLKAKLQQNLNSIEFLASDLSSQKGETAQTYAGLLKAAVGYPNDDCIYSVNSEPVLTFWGFGLPTGHAQKAAPVVLSPITPAPASNVTAKSQATAEPAPAASTMAVPVSKASFWQRYGWWALLALILLFGLLSLTRGCGTDFPLFGGTALDDGSSRPATSAPEAGSNPVATSPNPGGAVETPAASVPTEPAGAKHVEAPAITPEVLQSNDVTVFDGRWTLASNNVINTRTGLPIQVAFEFDQNGNGQAKVTELNGDVCLGTAQARITPPDNFSLRSDPLRCSRGGHYNPVMANCTIGVSREANCTLRGSDGPFSARFNRTK